jgi:hypothetical protein
MSIGGYQMGEKYIFLVILLILAALVSFVIYKCQELKKVYNTEVLKELQHAYSAEKDILTEEDIKSLPYIVQKYIGYSNSIGKEKVRNFKVVFEGEFRTDPKKDWAKINALQYTDLTDTTRLYYMDLKMFGLPVLGFHKYSDAKATMLGKVAGIIKVIDGKGAEMDKGETVTVFNDMCMLAPGSLIDKRIEWQTIDPLTVRATFTNHRIKISAILYFNEKGELKNFTSEDRYYSPTGKTYEQYRWSTPTEDYKEYSGIRISCGGEAVWALPEGDYSYGRIKIKEIQYNVK